MLFLCCTIIDENRADRHVIFCCTIIDENIADDHVIFVLYNY